MVVDCLVDHTVVDHTVVDHTVADHTVADHTAAVHLGAGCKMVVDMVRDTRMLDMVRDIYSGMVGLTPSGQRRYRLRKQSH